MLDVKFFVVLLCGFICVCGQGFTPLGQVGGHVGSPLMGMTGGFGAVARPQEIPFTPSPIDIWMRNRGYGAWPSGQTSPSPWCSPQWYLGCEPWHNNLPFMWRSYMRPYNRQYNYKDWRAHVDPASIPMVAGLLNMMRSGMMGAWIMAQY